MVNGRQIPLIEKCWQLKKIPIFGQMKYDFFLWPLEDDISWLTASSSLASPELGTAQPRLIFVVHSVFYDFCLNLL